MTYFEGTLAVAVADFKLRTRQHLEDPCVELSVGNQLHSTPLPPPQHQGKGTRKGTPGRGRRGAVDMVEFRGVTEDDVLTVTVLDRAAAMGHNIHGSFAAEAEPLLCTDWGTGNRPRCRYYVVAAPEELTWRNYRHADSTGMVNAGVSTARSTVQLLTRWSPKLRLRKPLSAVAEAGETTGKAVSSKIDRPVSIVLDVLLDAIARACSLAPRWRDALMAISLAGFSLGSACLVAVAAFFFPVTLAIAATAVAFFPPTVAAGWVLACTSPARQNIWRPLLIWLATRSELLKSALLLPLENGSAPAIAGVALGDDGEIFRGENLQAEEHECDPVDVRSAGERRQDVLMMDRSRDNGTSDSERSAGQVDARAFLLWTCYHNLMAVLHTGLEGSRWRHRNH